MAAATAAVLELIAAEQPELLDFQLEAFLNSALRFAVCELAAVFGVPLEKVGFVVYKATRDLDRLEQRRGAWRDPAKILESPNVAALAQLCRARGGRVRTVHRRRKLEAILRKLERSQDLARSRAWIEDFIGPPLPTRPEVRDADR